ncbi:phosphotransferase family enzyme [Ciceribacter lividus]|uniref:Phosphotransferase family enzyme n=1 Tax=Ciceribacter lividus TaxID=1197950 RepID=A0A6I7HH71_9HYPH|nr:phosphotransferase [Ciceribacter lividus]RCW19814.1 phosphotransferase family enzyme [Ciceribacter lividus]
MSVRLIDFPPELARFEYLAKIAFERWAPEGEVAFRRLRQGVSGAAVVRVDIRPTSTGPIPSGEYILKLTEPPTWGDQETEDVCHKRAFAFADEFSRSHVPALAAIEHIEPSSASDGELEAQDAADDVSVETGGSAVLFEIAGGSLERFAPMDSLGLDYAESVARSLAYEIARNWSAANPHRSLPAAEVLRDWLGYRVDPEAGKGLREFVDGHLTAAASYTYGSRRLIDPLAFYELCLSTLKTPIYVIDGLCHGDLHGGNVLLHRRDPETKAFWLIDFGLSREAPIGFDQAYLEMSWLVSASRMMSEVDVVDFIDAVNKGENVFRLRDASTRSLGRCVRSLRDGLGTWVQEFQLRRQDDVSKQLLLARIAAGLNWANKSKLDEQSRMVALTYASLAVEEYLREYHSEQYIALLSAQSSARAEGEVELITETDIALWNELVAACHHFDAASYRYVLIADTDIADGTTTGLGSIPFSAIFDLDPKSDEKGLHANTAAVVGQQRGVHTFDDDFPTLDWRRGTAWMMAGGWKRRGTLFDDDQWRFQRHKVVRAFAEQVAKSFDPYPTVVFVVPGQNKSYRLTKTIEAVDEALSGRAYFIVVDKLDGAVEIKNRVDIRLSRQKFLALLSRHSERFGVSDAPQLPAGNGAWTEIPYEQLRVIEENLEILHSRILLEEEPISDSNASSFWRGRPPSWRELDAGMDVTRTINQRLVVSLRERLAARRTETVLLYHTPGSGGTTAARRAAWDLRGEYPVAVLRSATRGVADRVRELYQATQQPILVIADASILGETAREDLYRALRDYNVPAVMLYIRRSLSLLRHGENLIISDPMNAEECLRFQSTYLGLVEDQNIKARLQSIGGDPKNERFRIPFFYGLVAFEREFESIDRYVDVHLGDTRGRAREIIELLSFATLYTPIGLPKSLIATLCGVSPETEVGVDALLGVGASRLLVERDRGYRMIHQLIAEECLNWSFSTKGNGWRSHLKDLSIRFVKEIVGISGPDSEFTTALLRSIFIDRVAGEVEDIKDRKRFAPVIEELDDLIGPPHGHQVLRTLTELCPDYPHFWTHRARHHIYRLRGGSDTAEEYLERAVSLAGSDPIHHHVYGLALGYRIRNMLRSDRGAAADAIVDRLGPYYRKATDEFRTARKLDPDGPHSYITNVQLAIAVCADIKRRLGLKSIADVRFSPHPEVGPFVDECMSEAEALLREVNSLYGTLSVSQGKYIAICRRGLRLLYDDYNEAIRVLERIDAEGLGDHHVRRVLVNTYLGRRQRRWGAMSPSETRRVVELLRRNLDAGDRHDDDYRLWFEGYRLLPEFDAIECLDRLLVWGNESISWRPSYYIYVIQFLRWLNRDGSSLEEMDRALLRCKQLLVGRRSTSEFWLGRQGERWLLVHEGDLGDWDSANEDRDQRFWKNPAPLSRLNGQIDKRIDGPQAGAIWIDASVRAFFVPGRKFSAHRDENKPVNFYVGFSPEGLRAWSVEPGLSVGGDRHQDAPVGVVRAAETSDIPPQSREVGFGADAVMASRLSTFARDLATGASESERALTARELALRVDAYLGLEGAFDKVPLEELFPPKNFSLRREGDETFVEARRAKASTESVEMTGYINRVFDERRMVSVISSEGKTWLISYDVFVPDEVERISSQLPVLATVQQRGHSTLVSSARIVDDRVFIAGAGLLDRDGLWNHLHRRYTELPRHELTPARLLSGIFPRWRCYEMLSCENFRGLISLMSGANDIDITTLSPRPSPPPMSVRPDKPSDAPSPENLRMFVESVAAEMDHGKGVLLASLGSRLSEKRPGWKHELKAARHRNLTSLLQTSLRYSVEGTGPTTMLRAKN